MTRSISLIKTLKKELRSKGITYKKLGVALQLSESAVKYMFAKHTLTLQRTDAICDLLGLELSDLVKLSENDKPELNQLSINQETTLVSNTPLLLVAYCALNHWTLTDIIDQYNLTETQCIQLLVQLDKMKLIELHTNNRIRLLASPNFAWQPNGPIERFFRQQVQAQFLNGNFQIITKTKLS